VRTAIPGIPEELAESVRRNPPARRPPRQCSRSSPSCARLNASARTRQAPDEAHYQPTFIACLVLVCVYICPYPTTCLYALFVHAQQIRGREACTALRGGRFAREHVWKVCAGTGRFARKQVWKARTEKDTACALVWLQMHGGFQGIRVSCVKSWPHQ
jgi:hypothetical protein